MLIVCLRTVLAYGLIILMLRLMGKRQLGELQPSELVTTILVSNLASLPIEEADLPIITALLPILIIVALEIMLSVFEVRSQRFASAVSGSPKVVIRDGEIDQAALAELRYGIDDLLEALRNKDVFDYREVAYGIIETNGNLNVYKKFDRQALTNDVFALKNSGCDRPPVTVVMDGVVQTQALGAAGVTETRIIDWLDSRRISLAQVYLLQIDPQGKPVLVLKKEEP